jgi:hypothetical protein
MAAASSAVTASALDCCGGNGSTTFSAPAFARSISVRAVLVRDAAIVARRRHAIMGAQILIAPGEVFLGIAIEIAERR